MQKAACKGIFCGYKKEVGTFVGVAI